MPTTVRAVIGIAAAIVVLMAPRAAVAQTQPVSIDPGMMFSFYHETISVNGPWALLRDRENSVPEIAAGTNGDAFFANYTVIATMSHTF